MRVLVDLFLVSSSQLVCSPPITGNDPGEGTLTSKIDRVYKCTVGDTSRQVIQTQVGTYSVTVATAVGSFADQCIQLLGGLSIHQLRWIYSDLSDAELIAQPNFDLSAVPFLDDDPNTRRWSELHVGCSDAIIQISGPNLVGSCCFCDTLEKTCFLTSMECL